MFRKEVVNEAKTTFHGLIDKVASRPPPENESSEVWDGWVEKIWKHLAELETIAQTSEENGPEPLDIWQAEITHGTLQRSLRNYDDRIGDLRRVRQRLKQPFKPS